MVLNECMTNIKPKEMEVVIYKTSEGKLELEVKLKEESLWMRQEEMARLFEVGRNTITRHINKKKAMYKKCTFLIPTNR
jgi:hypothetical protein